jgi:hypothetical protein
MMMDSESENAQNQAFILTDIEPVPLQGRSVRPESESKLPGSVTEADHRLEDVHCDLNQVTVQNVAKTGIDDDDDDDDDQGMRHDSRVPVEVLKTPQTAWQRSKPLLPAMAHAADKAQALQSPQGVHSDSESGRSKPKDVGAESTVCTVPRTALAAQEGRWQRPLCESRVPQRIEVLRHVRSIGNPKTRATVGVYASDESSAILEAADGDTDDKYNIHTKTQKQTPMVQETSQEVLAASSSSAAVDHPWQHHEEDEVGPQRQTQEHVSCHSDTDAVLPEHDLCHSDTHIILDVASDSESERVVVDQNGKKPLPWPLRQFTVGAAKWQQFRSRRPIRKVPLLSRGLPASDHKWIAIHIAF